MVTVASRQETTEVRVEHYPNGGEDDPEMDPEVIRFRMRTLSDDEFGRIADDQVSFDEDGTMRMEAGVSRLVQVFRDKVVGAENLDVATADGEGSFDAKDPAHIDAIPFEWKAEVAGKLLEEASLTEAQLKN